MIFTQTVEDAQAKGFLKRSSPSLKMFDGKTRVKEDKEINVQMAETQMGRSVQSGHAVKSGRSREKKGNQFVVRACLTANGTTTDIQ